MKTFVLLVTSLICITVAQAQENDPRKFYIGVGSGLNYSAGLLGLTAEYQIIHNLSVNGAIGLGSWGNKVSGGLKYYINYPGTWAFSLGYAHSLGLKDISFELDGNAVHGQAGKEKVPFKLLPVNTINISAVKYWLVGKRKKNRLHLELGYAIPTANAQYETSATLTKDGKTFMKILQPGGLLLGFGYSVGL